VDILDEYQQMREANPGFDPVRPVIAANVRPAQRDVEVPMITDSLTARVTDLFNVGYEILLQIFHRYFAHTEETDAQLKTLADATIHMMVAVLQPLANVITTLPAGPGHEGKTAGPSFELFYPSDYLLPHREAAWMLLTERLDTAALFCKEVGDECDPGVARRLTPVTTALRQIAQTLAEHLPAGRSHIRAAAASGELDQADHDADQQVTFPDPGQPVGFAAHIKPLFRPRDRESMSFGFDLWAYEDVKAHAADILDRLRNGSMPCDGAWPQDRVEVFERWTATQMRP